MAAPKTKPASSAAARQRAVAAGRCLPPVSVAHFEEAMRLLEQLVDTQADTFIAAGQSYREKHRSGTERDLNADEAMQIAAGVAAVVAAPPLDVAVALQRSQLRAYDEPEPIEVLLSAGVATAPGFMTAAKRFTALIELPAAELERLVEGEALDGALDDAVDAMTYEDLQAVRARAHRAFAHFAQAAGAGSEKGVGLLLRAWEQARKLGMTSLGYERASSSLIGSPPSITGADATSSTPPGTSTP
jgi:hypothetical protein